MGRTTSALLPAVQRLLRELGENLRLARLRRCLQAKQVAERAGMSVMTLRAVEGGSPGASIGAYAAVLQVLGLERDLGALAREDPLGRRLQDAALDTRFVAARPRRPGRPARRPRGEAP